MNTTIACILTNGKITKAQINHIADMAHDGLARAIDPVHTGFDGDAIFALSSSSVSADPNYIGILAAWVIEEAIHDAVLSAKAAYGLPCANELQSN
jgi:L-aminopeptidase/D-esterase-like protein